MCLTHPPTDFLLCPPPAPQNDSPCCYCPNDPQMTPSKIVRQKCPSKCPLQAPDRPSLFTKLSPEMVHPSCTPGHHPPSPSSLQHPFGVWGGAERERKDHRSRALPLRRLRRTGTAASWHPGRRDPEAQRPRGIQGAGARGPGLQSSAAPPASSSRPRPSHTPPTGYTV